MNGTTITTRVQRPAAHARGALARAALACVSLAAIAFRASALSAQGTQASASVTAVNALAVERLEEIVSVPWAALTARVGVTAERVRVRDGEGRELLSQAVDDDGDGRTDALLFQASFGPGETRRFTIDATVPAKQPARVHIRHDDPRDDIAWESDRGAWRIYGEGLKKTPSAMSSSGIDVWAKRTRALIVDKWYAKGHDAYHIDTGEGADFFDVGETLGAGGTAVWKGDTLYRADNFKAWKVIANGPLRAVFELRYDPWKAPGLSVSEVKRVSVDAGQLFYRQESVFAAPGAAAVPYTIGLVKRPGLIGSTSRAQPWAWVSAWGPVALKNGGHGELGTAVLLPRERVSDWKEAHNHYLAISSATPGTPVVHYIGAAWTAAGEITSPQQWWRYLDAFAQRLQSPIRTTIAP